MAWSPFPIFLSLMLLFPLFVTSVFSREYSVGLRVGDWAEYESITGTRAPERFKIKVIEISATIVKYVREYQTPSTPQYSSIDVNATPVESWGQYPLIIASGLDLGEPIYNSKDAPLIDSVSERVVAGAVRKVSHLIIKGNPYGATSWYSIDLYYDKVTGLMVSVDFKARGLHYKSEVVSTNLWQIESTKTATITPTPTPTVTPPTTEAPKPTTTATTSQQTGLDTNTMVILFGILIAVIMVAGVFATKKKS